MLGAFRQWKRAPGVYLTSGNKPAPQEEMHPMHNVDHIGASIHRPTVEPGLIVEPEPRLGEPGTDEPAAV